MDIIYAIVMLIAGLILIVSLSKENKVFYVAGGYFLLLGIWWLVDFFQKDVNLFAGGWGIAFKVLTAAGAAWCWSLVFVREYRANRRKSREEAEPQKEESPEDQDGLF